MKNERNKNNETELLYEQDGMLMDFRAVVISAGEEEASKKPYVCLDRTAFFPEGGGQMSDTGTLECDDTGIVNVTDVQTVDGSVRHYVDKSIAAGEKITGHIDRKKRMRMMQDHGAEHLVCGLIHNLFGYENVGFHMTDEEVVVDVSGPLTDEQIRMIEEKANEIVFRNVPVTISFPSPEEALKTEYRSKLDIYENVRLVTIEGVDVCACCAPHVSSTGQFGVIKILSYMPHRGGMRMTLAAGADAYADYTSLHDSNAIIMDILSAPRDKTGSAVADHMDRFMALKEENTSLRRALSDLVTQKAVADIRENGQDDLYVFFTDSLDQVGLRNLVNECTKGYTGVVCAFLGDDSKGYRYIFGAGSEAADVDLIAFTKAFNEETGSKGGGSGLQTTGQTPKTRLEIENYVDKIRKKA
ncbi:MAG: alanyl-tRNA editing protein [Lachnospiraceae bacterium]|nr:alanyl-tRNA editing protein [Lachnospiraceae bacterium]